MKIIYRILILSIYQIPAINQQLKWYIIVL
nr:MAG TPA: hypothetical protein [Caudoviricetes sp.]DAY42241.1 MAG TPA: hypothetical protein [Caudoviricetes sp.]